MNNLGDLEIFARVVSAGSMSAAGRELGLSPAVVSKRLRRLEDRLGTRLMQRTTRQISLTEAGQGFYERVVAILAGIEEAEAFVSRRSALAHGVLKVSAPTSFGRMHIAPHINAFMQANPDLGVNLMLHDEFVDIVGDGYDLAIRIAELSDSSLVARKLAPVRRILVASPDYLKRQGTPQGIEDLDRHICLAPHNNDAWKLEGPRARWFTGQPGRCKPIPAKWSVKRSSAGSASPCARHGTLARSSPTDGWFKCFRPMKARAMSPFTQSMPAAGSCRPRCGCS
jgi:DNA-binding transcriptional LysR family regulator